MVDATSKMSLKMSCLRACDNNVSRAKELYDFLSSGITELPDMTPVRPSGFELVKTNLDQAISWVGGHKEELMQGIDMIRAMRKSPASVRAVENVEPIPKI